MTYTLEEAKFLSDDFIQQCEEIHNLEVSNYEQDVRVAHLLTEMEYLGIPLLMKQAQSWSKESEGNALLLQTYQQIGNTRVFQ